MSDFLIGSARAQKIVLIGDSITDCGRQLEFPPLGNGYVSIAANLVAAKYPGRKIEWVNKGISGDVVQGLVKRWTEDVVNEKPDWVSIAIGINNVASEQFSGRRLKECLGDFEGSYRNILERTRKETTAKTIVFEVFYVQQEDQFERSLNVNLYNEIIRELASEYNAILVPIRSAFKEATSKRKWQSWTTGDGVHPFPIGHTLIALTFLRSLNF